MAVKAAKASGLSGHATAKKRKRSSGAKVGGDPPAKKKKRLHVAKSIPSDKGQSNSSKETHAKQKQLAQERKAVKPLADEVYRTKKIWERLRCKSHVPKEERQKLLQELFAIITGRIKDVVLKHDAVRAVQTALKYSTAEQRRQIAKELQGAYAQLAEGRYAKFLIGKLLSQSDHVIRDIIVPEFYGKVRRLINHPEASWILDDIYRGAASAQQKSQLLREWYGSEFALIKPNGLEATGELAKILEDAPSKRATVLKYLFDAINGLIQKKMTGFTMLHDAMLQYFLNTKPGSDERNEFIEVVKADENGDLLKNMAFTKPGARLVCLFLAYGSSKDRKQLLRAFKDTFRMMSGGAHAHMVLLAAYDVIDDTVLTSKTIFPELFGKEGEQDAANAIFLANHLHARKTVCYLFEGRSRVLFPNHLDPDLALLDEIQEIRKRTSKKNPETRHKELVVAMSPLLLSVVALSARDLVSSSFGCQLVTHALLSATGDKAEALRAIAETATGDPDQVDDEEAYPPPRPHVSSSSHAGRMFKILISGGRFDKTSGVVRRVDPPLKFADMFYSVIKDHAVRWATGPSSFAVLALVEAGDFSAKDELCGMLKAHKQDLERAQRGDADAYLSRPEKAKGEEQAPGKCKAKDGKPEGNMGSGLLLERLFA